MKPVVFTAVLALTPLVPACRSNASAAAEEPVKIEKLAPYTCGSIANMHTLSGVFLASQPSASDFEAARAAGVKTVVNLRTPAEQPDFDEQALVTGLGLAYVHLPWNGADQLTDEVFTRSRELLNTAERPLLVHCASANRVGAVWIPWRVLDGGLTLDEAAAEARTIGLKTAEYEAKARDYVARHPRPKH